MKTELILNMDPNVIEEAKSYAKDNGISLSTLIEKYLHSLTDKNNGKSKVSPLVESLTGVISLESNYRKEYSDYLSKKY